MVCTHLGYEIIEIEPIKQAKIGKNENGREKEEEGRKEEGFRPGLKIGNFQSPTKTEPRRISTWGFRHSLLEGLIC